MLLNENAFNTNQSDQLIANLVALFPWQFWLQLFFKKIKKYKIRLEYLQSEHSDNN